jgi:serine/threonine protein kinase
MVVGTPAYVSPEQAAADPSLDGRTDIYSLATVLYEMLAGELPFTGRTAQALIAKRLSTLPPSVRVVRPSVPGSIDLALRKALAPAPADRYRSAAAFAHALALDERGRATPAGVGPDLSIAVLPFVDLSADSDNEYFSDGAESRARTPCSATSSRACAVQAVNAAMGVTVSALTAGALPRRVIPFGHGPRPRRHRTRRCARTRESHQGRRPGNAVPRRDLATYQMLAEVA